MTWSIDNVLTKLTGTRQSIFKTCTRYYFTDTFKRPRFIHINANPFRCWISPFCVKIFSVSKVIYVIIVRLSLLTMTNPNQPCDVLLFVCSRMADETNRSEEESSVGDALALAFHCARFCSASLIRFASYSPAPLLMRPRHFVRSCAICSHDSVGILKSLRML